MNMTPILSKHGDNVTIIYLIKSIFILQIGCPQTRIGGDSSRYGGSN